MGRHWTDEERSRALAIYVEQGPAVAASETGIPKGTIASWASRAGLHTRCVENAIARTEHSLASIADMKAQLARDLLHDVQRLRAQLFAPCVERKAMVVGDARSGSHVEIVDVDRDQPTFGDQKQIITAVAIGIDKVQILTGEATEITEHRHLDAVDDELRRLSATLEERASEPV